MPYLQVLLVALLLTTGQAPPRAETLSFSLGGEVTELEITHCRTDPYAAEGVVVVAEITAVGSFRGEPAALFMRKIEGGTAYDRDQVEIYLTELSPERRTMPPRQAEQAINDDIGTYSMERTAEIMADYAPEKMGGLSADERMAKIQEMTERLDRLQEELKARTVPYAEGYGAIAVEGSTLSFEGGDMQQVNGEPAAAFADLGGPTRVTAECDR